MSDNIEKQDGRNTDLAASSRTGLGRWMELVTDGDEEAVQEALDAVGDTDEVEDLQALMEALGMRHALYADMKDDESVQYALEQIAEQRGLDGFAAPEEPPAGAARCSALLQAFADWVEPRGYVAVALDDDWDNWSGVLVRRAHHDELLALSGELGIPARGAHEAWADGDEYDDED